jgi:hypothetical protein
MSISQTFYEQLLRIKGYMRVIFAFEVLVNTFWSKENGAKAENLGEIDPRNQFYHLTSSFLVLGIFFKKKVLSFPFLYICFLIDF